MVVTTVEGYEDEVAQAGRIAAELGAPSKSSWSRLLPT
jgi:hypothetical protein